LLCLAFLLGGSSSEDDDESDSDEEDEAYDEEEEDEDLVDNLRFREFELVVMGVADFFFAATGCSLSSSASLSEEVDEDDEEDDDEEEDDEDDDTDRRPALALTAFPAFFVAFLAPLLESVLELDDELEELEEELLDVLLADFEDDALFTLALSSLSDPDDEELLSDDSDSGKGTLAASSRVSRDVPPTAFGSTVTFRSLSSFLYAFCVAFKSCCRRKSSIIARARGVGPLS
jgi:hypothetical protein